MRIHHFSSEIWLARPIKEVFAFFSDAANLDSITPPWVSFRTVTRQPIEMHVGAVIDYRLRVRGFPIRWRSEITAWEPPYHFVDEQTRGPYRLWIHAHKFESRNGGALVCDDVRYAVPFDWLLHKLIVRPDVERIFAYRADCLRRRFGNV
ncbi:MAG: CDP-paratose 2-epimerase [Verrucomicrobia bacterium]|nr:MAG: CDP-paratose 2-epimerase [Verrucomicrobiota bacterium]